MNQTKPDFHSQFPLYNGIISTLNNEIPNVLFMRLLVLLTKKSSEQLDPQSWTLSKIIMSIISKP